MDRFLLQRRVYDELCKTRPTVKVGLARALHLIEEAGIVLNFRAARTLVPSLAERSLHAWVKWANALHKASPVPASAEVLWAEVPNELNHAWTSFTAFEQLMSARDGYGLEGDVAWPPDDAPAKLSESLALPQLDTILAALGWKHDDKQKVSSRTLAAVYAMQTSFVALLLLNGLPKSNAWKCRQGKPLSVILGWSDGDPQPLGTLNSKGWSIIRRVKGRAIAPSDRRLQPNEFGFDLPLYVRRGGNIHAKNRKGESILLQMRDVSANDIRLLKKCDVDFTEYNSNKENVLHLSTLTSVHALRAAVQAGADVNLISGEGETALMRCSWRKPAWLKVLLAAGADPNRTGKNTTLLDLVVGDLRRPMSLVRWLEARGARLGPQLLNSETPLCRAFQSCAPLSRSRRKLLERVRYCKAKGQDLNLPKDEPPIWATLKSFAFEAEWNQRYYAENPQEFFTQEYDWNTGYDDVVVFLLSLGADPNARFPNGYGRLIPKDATPLMVRRYQSTKLVKALLDAGADPTIRSAEGKTALDYARLSARKGDILANLHIGQVIAVLEAATPKPKMRRSS